MTRRVIVFSVILGIVFGAALTSVAAKGRCRSELVTLECSNGDAAFLIPGRECKVEGRTCNRDGSICETLWVTVDCSTDGGTGTVRAGMGCYCGGGSLGTVRSEDPVSVGEFLRMLESLPSEETDGASCEAPPQLTALQPSK